MRQKTQLEILRESHFEVLRKNNAITDAKNGLLSLGAMKTMDIILRKYQEVNSRNISLELSFLRKKLGLESNNDYVDRIKAYLLELKLPFELRDYTESETGKRVEWQLTSFLGDVKSYKETVHLVEITITSGFVDYMVEKAGYTQINLSVMRQFKTKYGYKLYELYRRYYGLPNTDDSKTGFISKTLDELNEKFGTNYSHPSKLNPGIQRGLDEIKSLTGEEISYFFDKKNKLFVFSWAREGGSKNKCIIPHTRIDELCEWIILHYQGPINDNEKFYTKLRSSIVKNTWIDLESAYRGMLKYKYGFESVDIDGMKSLTGKYSDFDKKPQATLF